MVWMHAHSYLINWQRLGSILLRGGCLAMLLFRTLSAYHALHGTCSAHILNVRPCVALIQ